MPHGHFMHSVGELAPLTTVYLPLSQSEHSLRPVSCVYLLTGHDSHFVDPASAEYMPLEQGVHSTEAAVLEYSPASHFSQVFPPFEIFPASHAVHSLLPITGAIYPLLQCVQSEDPAVAYLPIAQTLHSVLVLAPSTLFAVPCGHLISGAGLSLSFALPCDRMNPPGQYDPGEQLMQEPSYQSSLGTELTHTLPAGHP